MFQHGQNIQAFLFDLDGILVETEIIYVKAVYQLLREEDCPMLYHV
jgi:beta-phosphoglucomutase-like phosphatase (HAD superfamily)